VSSPPDAATQLRFLQQLQRLLNDGSFVATYKFALLHAIADLCVHLGDDGGGELRLDTRHIAEQFCALYWRQVIPFPAGRVGPVLLRQNTGRQAAILNLIEKARREHEPGLHAFRRTAGWERLVRRVDAKVREMPLWRLQTVGRQTLSFLYPNTPGARFIVLEPGIAYCFRAFHPLVVDFVRGAWLRFVRVQNGTALGEASELSAFLFGAERTPPARLQAVLRDLQHGICFYCDREVKGVGAVDHFIPWSRYPVDLGHNLVLAHATCNGAKSDHLPAERHLERWVRRDAEQGDELSEQFERQDFPQDRATSLRITGWAYAQVSMIGGSAWDGGRSLVPLTGAWKALLRGAA
jgi:hypothetical protein